MTFDLLRQHGVSQKVSRLSDFCVVLTIMLVMCAKTRKLNDELVALLKQNK